MIAALRSADGIFLAGGDQGNYIRYWKGTPVQDALNAHVRADHPIGGSSAGLAILGHYSYTALDGGSMESQDRAAPIPSIPGVTLEGDFLHLRWLESVITDTHFSKRCQARAALIVFVARANQAAAGRQGVRPRHRREQCVAHRRRTDVGRLAGRLGRQRVGSSCRSSLRRSWPQDGR